MVTTKLNLSMTEPSVRQIYAKQGDTGRVLDIALDQTPEDGTLRILRPDGVEVTSEAVTGGEVESGSTFESLTEADVTELSVGIEPVQDLSHGDPSPSNICPISGRTGLSVYRTGVNVWDEELESGYIYNGRLYPSNDYKRSKNFVSVVPGAAYYLYGFANNGQINCFDKAKAFQSAINFPSNRVFTVPDGCYYIKFYNPTSAYDTPHSINYPSTDHDYHAYQGSTYTTSLGQTVYGGTLDMVSGVLTVDRVMVTAPTRESLDSSGKLYRLNGFSGQKSWNYSSQPTEYAITNQFSAQSLEGARQTSDKCFAQYADGFYIGGFVGDTATLDTLLTTLQVVYELATPTTYQLTAQQIKTLVGTNNVWASSGDIVNIKFTYGGLLSELPSDATSVAGKCYCDVEQNGVSSMPFTLNVKKNERES